MTNNKPTKLIIGLIGEIASGKDTAADYLTKKYNFAKISFSEPLREILDMLYLPQNRSNMANLGHDLRQRFGADILSQTVKNNILKSKKKYICLPNIRLPGDIKAFTELKPILVYIKAETKIRYERLIARNQNQDDQTKTWQQFKKDSQLPTEKSIRKIAKQAKYQIDNNSSYQNLYHQLDQLMTKIKK